MKKKEYLPVVTIIAIMCISLLCLCEGWKICN